MVKGINHIGILVRNLDEALRIYQNLFGAKPAEIETIPERGVKAVMVNIGGDTELEFLEPLPESSMAKTLEKRGEGIQHICFEVDNIEQELASLSQKGAELIDKKARPGLEGIVAFIHPKSTKGVLVELCQTDII